MDIEKFEEVRKRTIERGSYNDDDCVWRLKTWHDPETTQAEKNMIFKLDLIVNDSYRVYKA